MTGAVVSHLGPLFTYGTANPRGLKLAYYLGGNPDGPPVLLWHGFLGTSHTWRKVAPQLAARGCAVLVPDMRGYGDSDKPDGTEGYDGASLAEDFRALVRAIRFGNGRRLTLVAHDMGAPPALIWAGTHPDEVAALHYLEEPVLLAEELRQHIAYTREATRLGGLWWWFMALAPELPETLIVGREEAFLRWFYRHYATDPSRIEDGAVAEYCRGFYGPAGVRGALGCYRAVFRTAEQTAPFVQSKLRVPVIGYGGAASQGALVGQALQAVATTVRTVVVDGCGHFLPEEAPGRIVDAVLEAMA